MDHTSILLTSLTDWLSSTGTRTDTGNVPYHMQSILAMHHICVADALSLSHANALFYLCTITTLTQSYWRHLIFTMLFILHVFFVSYMFFAFLSLTYFLLLDLTTLLIKCNYFTLLYLFLFDFDKMYFLLFYFKLIRDRYGLSIILSIKICTRAGYTIHIKRLEEWLRGTGTEGRSEG